MLNDLIARAFAWITEFPAAKQAVGLVRQEGKRPDGLTLLVMWDVTVVCSTDESYIGI